MPDESGFTFPESEVENEQLCKLAESYFRSEEHLGSRWWHLAASSGL